MNIILDKIQTLSERNVLKVNANKNARIYFIWHVLCSEQPSTYFSNIIKWNLAWKAQKKKKPSFLDNKESKIAILSDECLSDTADEKLRTYFAELKAKTYGRGQFSSVADFKIRIKTFLLFSSDSLYHW